MKKQGITILLLLALLSAFLIPGAFAAEGEGAPVVFSGVWGESAAFALTEDGVLTVTGSGELREGEMHVTFPSADADLPAFDTLVVSEGVTRIGANAFATWGMKKAVLYGDVGNGAFWECTRLETVWVMNAETVGNGAFEGCSRLKEVYLADSIKTIAAGAFDFCHSLPSIRIPQKIMTLHTYTFRECTALETITMPAVQHVESDCFLDCTALKTVQYAGTEAQLQKLDCSPRGNVSFVEAEFILLPSLPDPFYGFFDMPNTGSWAYAGIRYCLEHGYMNGMGGGYFCPDAVTTRAQLVTILWRMSGEPKAKGGVPFSDCDAAWAKDAVTWAAEHKIVSGVGQNRFAPNAAVTREQLVTIFYRYYKEYLRTEMESGASLSAFPDAAKVSSWAQDAMEWAVDVGLISGVGTEHGPVLLPQGGATRAQIARVIMNDRSRDASGSLRWYLSREGTLTITGSGTIPDYTVPHPENDHSVIAETPWADYQSEIRAVVVCEGITRIGSNVFCNAHNLRSVTLPSTLREIGDSAFCNDPIRVLKLPQGLQTIGAQAFMGAEVLELILPDSVTALGESAFCGLIEAQEIRVGEGVTALPRDVFCNCPCLKTIYLPAGLRTMHADAFRMTQNLERTYFGGTEAQWNALTKEAPGFIYGRLYCNYQP